MSAHLPECAATEQGDWCICPELRAAEERLWIEFLAKSNREDVYDRGINAGLDKAREAVAAEANAIRSEYAKPTHRLRVRIVDRLLAAIGALKEVR